MEKEPGGGTRTIKRQHAPGSAFRRPGAFLFKLAYVLIITGMDSCVPQVSRRPDRVRLALGVAIGVFVACPAGAVAGPLARRARSCVAFSIEVPPATAPSVAAGPVHPPTERKSAHTVPLPRRRTQRFANAEGHRRRLDTVRRDRCGGLYGP